ncbi:MAG TPA: M1 family metallopeptidase [Candidatus Binataceae bacterium]|nr:M1 family metallopeptidase [Candidatus Binataceae bacterium]
MMDQEGAPLAADNASEYRLPKNVVPERYDISLTPDLKAFTFAGEERVTVRVAAATSEVLLNALELEIDRVSAERAGIAVAGKAALEPAHERARLSFERALEPGEWTLRIAFRGILNDKLHGFYRSTYKDAQGRSHLVASTQFEATDARRAIPCWDEPAFKARFKVRLVIDEGLTAFSNGGVEGERSLGGGKKEVVFRETIRMSSYLLAFVVGEFEATEPVDAGTPLRIAHVPGKRALTAWGREIGAFSLKWFADYYGLPYPGDKLDLIAIPDFASGAMENLGAITFRETALLIDEKTASRAELERVADVVAHENAHMWFGDLVTMEWWNGIWLNEAFATFMEMLAVDAWKPHWKRWESFSVSRTAAMAIDALSSTRPIEFTVRGPEDARAMFDVLTYEKGASVLRMLEQYLGAERFRRGIADYLRKHQFANAETGDLWDALERASDEPVRKLMDSWIFQPGFPMVEAELQSDRRSLKLRQRRFFYLPGEATAAARDQLWQVPVMVRAKTSAGVSTHRLLLEGREATLDLGGSVEWALLNQGGHGFYRVRYSADLLAALGRNLNDLQPVERYALVSDSWAATVAGLMALGEMLAMLRAMRGESDLNVWRAMLAPLHYLDLIVSEAQRPALAAAVREIVGAASGRMGLEARAGEDELTRQLRGMLWGALGTLGEDAEAHRQAAELYARYGKDAAAIDRDLVPPMVSILAAHGDRARYEEFKQRFKSAGTPQEEQRYLFSLAGFRSAEPLRETMEMTLNGEVRTQNAPYLMHSLLLNPTCRYEAWEFVKRHWEEMIRKFPDAALPRMCEAVVALLDREREVHDFFKAHRVRLGGKIIDQHLERLRVAVAFRAREGANLASTLKG